MHAPSDSVEQTGARLPRQMPHRAVEIGRAFWCEHTSYETDFNIKKCPERYVVDTPAEAVRKIRVTVRRLAQTLPPLEQHRALDWADAGGCLQAMGALHRGEPCGFSISSDGTWVEWTVRPFDRFLVPDELLLPLVPVHSAPRSCTAAH